MTTFTFITLILVSAFAIGAYNHYTADNFAFRKCLRENMKRAVVAANVAAMVKLEKAIRKTVKGSGVHYMLTGKWKELPSYNVAIGSI